MGAGVSSGSGGPAADMYERLVKAVLGRDKEASAGPGAQETAERLLRVLQAQAQNLKVRTVGVRRVQCCHPSAPSPARGMNVFLGRRIEGMHECLEKSCAPGIGHRTSQSEG